jgi:uncharacterized protein YjbI with pentapeptide repeats
LTEGSLDPQSYTNQYGQLISDAIVGNNDFAGANLSNTRMSNLNLSSSNLDFSSLEGADIAGGELPGSIVNVDADHSNLAGIVVRDARWYDVSLIGANLRGAKLANSAFGGTDQASGVYNEDAYGPVDMRGADLRGADLAGAQLDGAILTGAIADSSTRWPTGFDPSAAGVRQAGSPVLPMTRLIPLPESGCP